MESEQFAHIPIRVRWHGWESDTYALRNCGWKIFVNEEMSPCKFEKDICLAVRDPEAKIMIMGRLSVRGEELFGRDRGYSLVERLARIGIDMQTYRATDRCYDQRGWLQMDAMEPSDGFASINVGHEERDIRELKLFKTLENAQEIFVPYQSVDECLNRILTLQFPDREKFKQHRSDVTNVERPIIQAKIYSLAA